MRDSLGPAVVVASCRGRDISPDTTCTNRLTAIERYRVGCRARKTNVRRGLASGTVAAVGGSGMPLPSTVKSAGTVTLTRAVANAVTLLCGYQYERWL